MNTWRRITVVAALVLWNVCAASANSIDLGAATIAVPEPACNAG